MLNISNYMLFKEIKIYKGEGSNLKKLMKTKLKEAFSNMDLRGVQILNIKY